MTNYLLETYGGTKYNYLENDCFYCYTIFDKEFDMYYSGSRGVRGTNTHDLLKKYFTSSTVKDFVERLKNNSQDFEFIIEYFNSRKDAFKYEKYFHIKHNVGKNKKFYNSANSSGSNWGAGSILCKSNFGEIYRISINEFHKNRHLHNHVSKNLINVIKLNTGKLISININEFDSSKHKTQFKDHVMCFDKLLNKKRRIPKNEFYNFPERYIGVTKNLIIAKDLLTSEFLLISKEEFNKNSNLVGVTHGKVPVKDMFGNKLLITKDEFNKNKSNYIHYNSNKLAVYSIKDRKILSISKELYEINKNNYVNLASKYFYNFNNLFFSSLKTLKQYYKNYNGKELKIPRGFNLEELNLIDSNIIVINRKNHQKGLV